MRRWTRRVIVCAFVGAQLFFVARAYWAPHKEFGFQMFPEASEWRADIVRVTDTAERIPVDEDWYGYRWNALVGGRGLGSPWMRHHADAGVDNQLAFLTEALAWVAANTPADPDTRYLRADVTAWHNMGPPTTYVLRSPDRRIDEREASP